METCDRCSEELINWSIVGSRILCLNCIKDEAKYEASQYKGEDE